MMPDPWFGKKQDVKGLGNKTQDILCVSQMGTVGASACFARLLSSVARQN